MSEDTSALINLDRLFSRTFSQRILGERLGMDLYGRNGFRLISISALTDKTETEHAIGKVQGRLRLRLRRKGADPDEVLRQTAMGLGYEQYIKLERLLEMLERPREIRRRICDELFWPHVRGRQGAEFEEFGSIASKEIRDYFESSTVASDRAQARRLHALAVAYHNYALAEETAFIKGQGA
ncbi:MAG TPA: hypothetical protein ENN65_00070 [Candidatus Hydrogenedentes bacterium]|nr:hypothetical protein [Candidatus Hydrogenedentota bacterium]